ncbi:hypothetical protein V6N13_004824 [Hibiscus sabdariffa]
MRSQPTARRQSPDWEPDDELHGRMDGCLATEVAADRGRNERQLLPVIGAVWARETTSKARRGVDGWSRLDGSGYREADASTRSFDNDDRRRVWCGVKRLGKIPTGGDWYGDDNIDDGGRVCGCTVLRFSVDLY